MADGRKRGEAPDVDLLLLAALRAPAAPERLRLRILDALDEVDRQPARNAGVRIEQHALMN